QFKVSDGRDDLYIGNDCIENHIEPHLVVAGTSAAMCHIVCADLFSVVGDGGRLAHPLRTYGKWIGAIFKHIAENEVFDAALIIVLRFVNYSVRLDPQRVSALLNLLEFFRRKTTGINNDRMDFQPSVLG